VNPLMTNNSGTRALEGDPMRSGPSRPQLTGLAAGTRLSSLIVLVAVAAVIVHAAFVLVPAPRAELTSDESLYIAQGLNIAQGAGPRYTTLDLTNHRPFLFPAVLAVPLKLSAGDFTTVYWVTKAVVLLNLAALMLLARRMFGSLAAALAVLLALPNHFLNLMGTSAYLDGMETFFLLVAMLFIWQGHLQRRRVWWLLGGAALALAFLTKESALLWAPLPALFVLLTHRGRELPHSLRSLGLFYATFGAGIGWWWGYVWAIDGRVYMWPYSPSSLVLAGIALCVLVGVCIAALIQASSTSPRSAELAARLGAAGAMLAWIAGFAVVMETTSWPYHHDFLATVPRYVTNVVIGNVQPWPVVGAALALFGWRSRRDPAARFVMMAVTLWLPIALFVAHRDFAMRSLLPMIYLGYVAAGVLLAETFRRLWNDTGTRTAGALAIAVLAGTLVVVGGHQVRLFQQDQINRHSAADWDNALVQRTATWIENNLALGTPIMSSRLYFSHLYTLTEARYPIVQLPTVNVAPSPGSEPYLRARSTLFRWEDARMSPPRRDERWLTVDEFATKAYFTALSEIELHEQIRRRGTEYLVISGEDVAFSSLRYVDYFLRHRAFELLYQDSLEGTSRTYVFRVHRSRLELMKFPTTVSASTLNSLFAQHRGSMSADELLRAISPRGVRTVPAEGLDPGLAAALDADGG
jgi:4-amino-4-deoxy-L-arabinose transferase-like glycosyltransferase